ncbi:MAG: spore coat associated protein CotJA [Clostridium sp.]|nr:spore coat associated protein CotJA [Clostridium sp.]
MRSYGRGGMGRNGYPQGSSQPYSYGRNNLQKFGNPNNCQSDNSCMRKTSCDCKDDCGDSNKQMSTMPLAMGFVPMQSFGELYDPCTALREGTAFPCLNLIFCGTRGKM